MDPLLQHKMDEREQSQMSDQQRMRKGGPAICNSPVRRNKKVA